jgi:PAS domain S-box-containing protein
LKDHGVDGSRDSQQSGILGVIGSPGIRRFLRLNPSTKAVVLLAVGMAWVIVTAASVMLFDAHQRETTRAKSEVVGLSRILSEQTTRTFDGVVLSIRGARERLSDEVGDRLELDSFLVHALLQARALGLPQVKSMFVVDDNGQVVNSSRQDFGRPFSVSQRAFYRYYAEGGSDEFFISQPERAVIDGEWAFYVSSRLVDASGQRRGLIVVAIQIGYFKSLYEAIALNFTSRVQLLNLSGVLMAENRHGDALLGTTTGDASALEQIVTQSANKAVVIAEHADGEKRFVAYQPVAGYPLVVSTAVDESLAYASWWHLLSIVALSIAGVLVLLAVAVWQTVRYLRRKEMLDAAIREGDDRLRHMIHSVKDGIVTVDSRGQVVLSNAAARALFGESALACGGIGQVREFFHDLPPSQFQDLQRLLDAGMDLPSGVSRLGALTLIRDGEALPLEAHLSTSTYRGERLLTVLFRDLSERRRAEQQVLESNRQLRELSNSLQTVREEERARISRELHDELGQLLTGIRMEVSWVGGCLKSGQERLVDKLALIKAQIDYTIATVRRISSDLRPLVLDDLGFSAAAGWYVDQFSERSGLLVNLALPEEEPEKGGAIATTLFRVMQEALTNVARHASATAVDVQLLSHEAEWMLSIRDDGVGFSSDSGERSGLGLLGMRERVEAIGGCFTITSSLGGGTLVDVYLPTGQ